MEIIAVISESSHYAALDRARSISLTPALSRERANAPLLADASMWLNDVWDQIELALDKAVKRGREAALPIVDRVGQLIDELLAKGASWVDDVLLVIRSRLSAYLKFAVQEALNLVQQSISVGEHLFKIERVVLAHTITLSVSVKASLTQVCEFVGEGEIELSAEYARAETPPV